jgi:hypothetical protein
LSHSSQAASYFLSITATDHRLEIFMPLECHILGWIVKMNDQFAFILFGDNLDNFDKAGQ